MLLYLTFIPNQNNYNMLGIKLGIKIASLPEQPDIFHLSLLHQTFLVT